MANATQLPTYANNKFFYWTAKLTDSLEASTTDTSIFWDTVPVDENNATVTGSFLIGVTNRSGQTELMWVPASAVAADGLSATNIVRGLKTSGLDYTAGSSTFVRAHQSGSSVFCAILPQDGELIRSAIQGLIQSGGTDFIMGAGSSATVTQKRATGSGTSVGWLRWNSSSSKAEYSNDGSTWNSIDSVTASNLVVVTGSDTTPSNLQSKTSSGTGITRTVLNPGANEQLEIATSYTATPTEINRLSGISANVTSTNLNTLTAGAASNADALHTHATLNTASFTAYEAVTADQAVALLPIETKWYDQLTDTVINLGNANTVRRYATKYIPSLTGTLTDWNFRAAEQVNGATALGNLVITIETDNAGAPSGTPLTNATATISQVTQRTWNTTLATRTATFGGTVNFTAGTTYWVVYSVSATDAANYLKFGANDSYVNNYPTFTRLTYNLDTATWGSSSTTSIPFGWSNTTAVPFGYAVVPTDANFGARTWNFVGFAAASASANASVSVETDMTNLTGLTPGATYYLSATAGAITTTAPFDFYQEGTQPTAFTYRIGRALSTTSLKINTGTKRVIVREATTITSTTTRSYALWFKPELIRVSGVGTGGSDSAISNGFVTADASDSAVGMVYENAAAGTAAGYTTVSLQVMASGNFFEGAGATFTDIGFNYTFTETGTANVAAILEATA